MALGITVARLQAMHTMNPPPPPPMWRFVGTK